MHNFELTEELSMVQETVARLVQDKIGPAALDHDEHGRFVAESFGELAESGLLGAAVGEDAGGAGLGMLSLVVLVEEVAKGCTSTARLALEAGGICGLALEGLESAAEGLGSVLMGEKIVAFVGPEYGIDVAEDGALSGTAEFVPAANGAARRFLVCGRTAGGIAVLVVLPTDAVKVEPVDGLGFRATAPGRVTFDSARGTELAHGQAAEACFARAELARQIGGAALAVGSALASIELSIRHTGERIAFGKPLLFQQAVSHKLVEARRRVEGARHLVWHAARCADAGREDALETARLARLSAIDAAVHAADEGIQVHGGYGYTVEYHVERHYRDAKTLAVLDGGVLAQREALAAILTAGVS